jgi:uncharacterized protein
MHNFTPIPAALGGVLIGLAASLYLASHGRVAGISGIVGSLIKPGEGLSGAKQRTGLAFLLGLLGAGAVLARMVPQAFQTTFTPSLPVALLAGLLVGVGTQRGGGCTSGHGVCGNSRLSIRSMTATCMFMATGFATVYVLRHLANYGGQS